MCEREPWSYKPPKCPCDLVERSLTPPPIDLTFICRKDFSSSCCSFVLFQCFLLFQCRHRFPTRLRQNHWSINVWCLVRDAMVMKDDECQSSLISIKQKKTKSRVQNRKFVQCLTNRNKGSINLSAIYYR